MNTLDKQYPNQLMSSLLLFERQDRISVLLSNSCRHLETHLIYIDRLEILQGQISFRIKRM